MDLRLPPMQALRAFEAAASTGSLTRAAEALHLTHGAISHQIKALEADLGVRLVERAGRGIRLTDEGQRFANRVRTAFAELADAVREMTDHANPRQLRVSVIPSFAARWLLPRMGRFLAAHPDIDLDVRANLALADFHREDTDVAIRYGFGDWPGLVAEHLFDEIFFPVCSPRYANGKLPARPADLAHHLLLRSDSEFWKPWFEAAGLDWPEPVARDRYSTTRRTCCRRPRKARASRSREARSSATTCTTAFSCGSSTSSCRRSGNILSSTRRGSRRRRNSLRSGSGSMTKWPPSVPSRRGRMRPVAAVGQNAARAPDRLTPDPRIATQPRVRRSALLPVVLARRPLADGAQHLFDVLGRIQAHVLDRRSSRWAR